MKFSVESPEGAPCVNCGDRLDISDGLHICPMGCTHRYGYSTLSGLGGKSGRYLVAMMLVIESILYYFRI
jgi:hypothetical protein